MRHVSTSVNWGDVAYYFGVLAFIAAIFAIRFGDFRRPCFERFERFDIDGYRAALALMATIYGLFVVCGIVLIVKAARA